MPKKAETQIQNRAPGPPEMMAVAGAHDIADADLAADGHQHGLQGGQLALAHLGLPPPAAEEHDKCVLDVADLGKPARMVKKTPMKSIT